MLLIHKILVILWESPHNILQPEPTMSNYKTFDETSWPWHTICLWLQSLRPLEVICQLYVSLRLPHFRKVTITFQSQKENTIIYASRGPRDNFIMVTFLKMRHSWWHIQLTNVTSGGCSLQNETQRQSWGSAGVLFMISCPVSFFLHVGWIWQTKFFKY